MVEPMTAKELAVTKMRVDAELAKSGTAALFDNVSDANSGKARHLASGLVCPLGKKGQRVLAASVDQASCETKDGSTVYETKVERAPEGATLETVAAKALADAQKEPGYAASGGVSVNGHPRPGSGLPDHQTLRFLSRIDGHVRVSPYLPIRFPSNRRCAGLGSYRTSGNSEHECAAFGYGRHSERSYVRHKYDDPAVVAKGTPFATFEAA